MSKAGCLVLTVSVWVCDQPWHCAQLPELLWIPPGNSPTLSLSPTLCLSFCLSYTASLYIPPGIGFGHDRHFFPSSFPLCLVTCTSQRRARVPLKGWLFFFFLNFSCPVVPSEMRTFSFHEQTLPTRPHTVCCISVKWWSHMFVCMARTDQIGLPACDPLVYFWFWGMCLLHWYD